MKNFYEKVYDIVAQIPKGKVTTYGCIAMRLGNIRLSRLVGNALHANTDPVNVPLYHTLFHKNEGVEVDGDRIDLEKYLWR